MTTSAIEWTDKVWNPVTGCRKVSAGCEHCYAEGVARRFWGRQYPGGVTVPTPADGIAPDDARPPTTPRGNWTRPRRFTDVMVHPERLGDPQQWRKPRRVFVNSMSDLFHESVPDEFIMGVFVIMASVRGRHHTYQILTKRPERARRLLASWDPEDLYLAWYGYDDGAREVEDWPLPNVHLGVSVEDQRAADERIPLLLDTPAAVRWISAEPLLGPVSLCRWDEDEGEAEGPAAVYRGGMSPGGMHGPPEPVGCWDMGLDWVVIGGESGPGARPCDVEWVRALVAECRALEVPVFVKQLGSAVREEGCAPGHLWAGRNPELLHRLEHSKGGDPSEWPEDLRVREFPA